MEGKKAAMKTLKQFRNEQMQNPEFAKEYMNLDAFYEARQQMANEPEMSLDEINDEITASRATRKS